MQQVRSRCRNQKCRTKLGIPTDNHHKAFCTPYCYNQFYSWKCKVCEDPILKGKRRKQPDHCHKRDCRLAFKRFPETFLYPKTGESYPCGPSVDLGARSAHFTGLKSAISALRAPPGARVIAGPPLSEFSLWAATLEPPKPRPMAESATRWHRQPGDIAAEWTAREMARRELEDEQYVAADEARLATEPVDSNPMSWWPLVAPAVGFAGADAASKVKPSY